MKRERPRIACKTVSDILQVVAILRGSSCVACTEHIGEDNMSDVVIKSHSDGPYHVKGHFKIVTDGDREIAVDRNEAWLRRCGHSANKPFCDSSHKKAGFKNNLDEKS